MFDMIKG